MRFVLRTFAIFVLISSIAFAGTTRPWPFGKEIRFPWKSLTGTWQVEDGSYGSLFNFKIGTNDSGEKEVQIYLVHQDPCYVMAQGKGVLSGKFVTAQMVSYGKTFNVTIHAFNSSDVSGANLDRALNRTLRSGTTNDKVVMALTVFPIGEPDKRNAFEITKLAPLSEAVCQP